MTLPEIRKPGDRRSVARWLGKQVVSSLLMAAALFVPSGDLAWGAGRLYLAVCVAAVLLNLAVLLPLAPGLLADRSGLPPGAKRWDIPLALLVGYSPLLLALAAGLEHGAGRPLGLAVWALVAAILLVAASYAVNLWAMVANRFFSGVVAIEPQTGHTVVDRGPYKWVRHPGYAGMMLFLVAAPLLLDSGWAAAAALLFAVVLVARTVLEDRALLRELPGYREYAARVRQRLVPGVW